jgi:hypothetical protein
LIEKGIKAMKLRVLAPAFARAGLALAAVCMSGPAFAASGPGTGSNTLQCAPYQVIGAGPYPTGGPYTAAADGIVTGVSGNDVKALEAAGCDMVGATGPTLIGRLAGANMNVTTDQQILLLIAPNQTFQITAIVVRNPSTSLSAAVGGVYTAASKGGTAVVASTQVYSAATGPTTVENATLSAGGAAGSWPAGTPLYLSLGTAQGAAATADVYVYGYVGQ